MVAGGSSAASSTCIVTFCAELMVSLEIDSISKSMPVIAHPNLRMERQHEVFPGDRDRLVIHAFLGILDRETLPANRHGY